MPRFQKNHYLCDMKKSFIIAFLLMVSGCLPSCHSVWENPNRLTAIVDFTIYPNSIREYELNSPGGFKYYSSDPESNSRGIIVYRVSMEDFRVWDRLPPNKPNTCCTEEGECTRLVVENDFEVVDNCNNIIYSILDGTILEGGEGYRLYPYNCTYDGSALRITTFY